MKKNNTFIVSLFSLLFAAAPTAKAQQPAFQDDDLTTESFTLILKEEWIYLRDALDQFNKETEKRGEFETTPEFQARVSQTRQTFLSKLNGHIKDTKMDSRVFGVWYKLSLVSYDADAGIYSVKCNDNIEAPYQIPTVECSIPGNSYVEMSDSIRGGYRTSSIRLKFNPDFKWSVSRNEAMAAKGKQDDLFFRVHFVVDLAQVSFATQATLKVIPKDIALINKTNKHVYWAAKITVEEKERKVKEEKKEIQKEKLDEDIRKETIPDKSVVN